MSSATLPRLVRHGLTFALTLVALSAPAAASAAGGAEARAQASSNRCAFADSSVDATTLEQVRVGTLCLMNAQRTARGLRSLRGQGSLTRVAANYARQMVDQRFFDHTSPSGSTMLSRIQSTSYLRHVTGWALGENIAWGTGELATPRAIVRAWMLSPHHRDNLLDRGFTEVGIGVAAGAPSDVAAGQPGATYVTDFGRRPRR
jgi:uncharacterized protein YkwD